MDPTPPTNSGVSTLNGASPYNVESVGHRKSTGTKTVRTTKIPTNIIQPAPFLDTLALLAVFTHIPSVLMIVVHALFLASYFSSANVSMSTRSVFGWTSSSPYNPPSSGPFHHSLLRVVAKIVIIDIGMALFTLYVSPILRNVVMVFAHAIVAASLGGGGSRIFTNAIYSTTLMECAIFIWSKLRFYIFADNILDPLMLDSRHLLNHHMVGDGFMGPPASTKSFNTLTSAWALIPSAVKFVRHLDWTNELPLICFQTVAIHVVGLGLVPFIRRVFPERGMSDSLPSTHGLSSLDLSGDNYIDPSVNYSVVMEPSSMDLPVVPGNTRVISVPDQLDVSESGDRYADRASFASDFDFLYAPSLKKNKRLATVRANQRLWSVLASSIVLAARHESENAESRMSDSTDDPSKLSSGQCYVRYITDSAVAFEILQLHPELAGNFGARVNHIPWPQVSVTPLGEDLDDGETVTEYPRPYLVIVHGLVASSQYEIELVYSSPVETVVYMTVNISVSKRDASSSGVQGIQAPPRPVSPVTTLLETLTTTQIALSDEKSRLKKSRRDHAKRLTNLRGEIDVLRGKIDAQDKGDERNNRKVLSLRESVRQLEEEIEKIISTTDELTQKQGEHIAEFDRQKEEWEAHDSMIKEKELESQNLRSDWEKKAQVLEAELSALATKCDKLETKQQRIASDIDKLDSESQKELDKEIEIRVIARQEKLDRRQKLEDEFANNISKLEKVVEDTRKHTDTIVARLSAPIAGTAISQAGSTPI